MGRAVIARSAEATPSSLGDPQRAFSIAAIALGYFCLDNCKRLS
jgi:hypothetical protein